MAGDVAMEYGCGQSFHHVTEAGANLLGDYSREWAGDASGNDRYFGELGKSDQADCGSRDRSADPADLLPQYWVFGTELPG